MKYIDTNSVRRLIGYFTVSFLLLLVCQDLKGFEFHILSSMGVKMEVTKVGEIYTYNYTFSNPATNTGNITIIDIEALKPPGGMELSGNDLVSTCYGPRGTQPDLQSLRKGGTPAVPSGMSAPPNWGCVYTSNSGDHALAGLISDDDGIMPGQTLG